MILQAKNKQNVRFLDFYRLKKRHSKTKMANATHTDTHTDVPIWPTSNACNCVHESKSRAYFSFSYFRSVAFDIISSHSSAFYNQTYKLANNLPFFFRSKLFQMKIHWRWWKYQAKDIRNLEQFYSTFMDVRCDCGCCYLCSNRTKMENNENLVRVCAVNVCSSHAIRFCSIIVGGSGLVFFHLLLTYSVMRSAQLKVAGRSEPQRKHYF